MPFFFGSFAASFLLATTLLLHFSPSQQIQPETKNLPQEIVHVSPISEALPILSETITATVSAMVIYGPPTPDKATHNQQPLVTASAVPVSHDSASLLQTVTTPQPLSPTPTIAPPSPTPTPSTTTPTNTPTPTPAHTMFVASIAIRPSPQPTIEQQTQISPPTSSPPANSLNADLIFSLVNQHRTSMGLTPFQKDSNTCAIAAKRAPEVYNEIYVTHSMHAGLHREQYPYWINENIISMDSEQHAVNWWLGDTIHREAIEGNYTTSCVACSGHSCSEIFTSYVPR